MQEMVPAWKRFNGLTPEEALSLLNARLPNFKCVVCEHDAFELAGDPTKNQHTRLEVHAYPELFAKGHLLTLTFICGNCGFIHNFDRVKLDPSISLSSIEGQDG